MPMEEDDPPLPPPTTTKEKCDGLLEEPDEFTRSLFASNNNDNVNDDDDDNDDDDAFYQDISRHVWTSQVDPNLSIIYHLALLAPGHGDVVWNASECIAEHLVIPELRTRLLLGTWNMDDDWWPPRRVVEFGAGAALPSLALLLGRQDGAHPTIVCSDRKINDMTFDALEQSVQSNCERWGISQIDWKRRIRLVPHTWGEDTADLKGDDDAPFDLLIASDCIYDPNYHGALLKSASACIHPVSGLFVVGYSYHGNVKMEQVEDFFVKAVAEFEFVVVAMLQKDYEGQRGIGSVDPDRGAVYMKVLAHKHSKYTL